MTANPSSAGGGRVRSGTSGIPPLVAPAGVVLMGIGLLVWAGWYWDLEGLKSLYPGWVSMKINTALSFFVCGLGLLCGAAPANWRLARLILGGCGLAVGVFGIINLAQYAFRWDAGIDELFFEDEVAILRTAFPGRMAPSTAMCFALVGCSLFLSALRLRRPWVLPLQRSLGMTVLVVGVFGFVGYLLDLILGYLIWNFTGMAAHTTLALVALGFGIYCLSGRNARFPWVMGKTGTLAFVLGLMAMFGTVNLAYHTARELLFSNEALIRHQVVLRHIEELSADLAALQRDLRRFWVTGAAAELAERKAHLDRIGAAMEQLDALTDSDLYQHRELGRVRGLLHQFLEWEESVNLRRSQTTFDGFGWLINEEKTISPHPQLRETLDRMRKHEYSLLEIDQTRADLVATTAFLLLPLSGFTSLGLLLGAMYFLNTSLLARGRAEESVRAHQAQLQTMFDNLAEGVLLANSEGHLTQFNNAGLAMFGLDRFADWRQHVSSFVTEFEIFASDGRPLALAEWPLMRVLRGENLRNLEVRIRSIKAGWIRYYSFSGTRVPEPDGNDHLAVLTIVDTTERRKAEKQIHALNADLERRVAVRTTELVAINKELDAFCYSVSHDLRAPLRGISGFSSILASELKSSLSPTHRGYFQRIVAATERMGRLIDDLLTLSRVSRDAFRRESVDISAIAEETMAELQGQDPDRQVETSIEPGLHTSADPKLVAILLQNLLGNAWKFTSKTPNARISLVGESRPGGKTCFAVKDNGAGFEMKYVHKLFIAFQRLHDPADFPGTGIGLATVQRIVNRHGGTITAESARGGGATFRFDLGDPSS